VAAAAPWDRDRAARMLPQLKHVNDWLSEIGEPAETLSPPPPVTADADGEAAVPQENGHTATLVGSTMPISSHVQVLLSGRAAPTRLKTATK
jgi:hypothetical protein